MVLEGMDIFNTSMLFTITNKKYMDLIYAVN